MPDSEFPGIIVGLYRTRPTFWQKIIQEEIDKLPEKIKKSFTLSYIPANGRTKDLKELAKILGIPKYRVLYYRNKGLKLIEKGIEKLLSRKEQ